MVYGRDAMFRLLIVLLLCVVLLSVILQVGVSIKFLLLVIKLKKLLQEIQARPSNQDINDVQEQDAQNKNHQKPNRRRWNKGGKWRRGKLVGENTSLGRGGK